MVSTSHHCNSDASEHYQFISIQNPDAAKDRRIRRLARSHAVKRALESKRKREQESSHNFRVVSFAPQTSKSENKLAEALITSSVSISAVAPDPFQMLAADSSRLHALLRQYKATKPVFSVADELVLQPFRSVLRASQDDPALLNAIMLTFAFAVTGNSVDNEFLGYQSRAMSFIRDRMSSLDRAVSESTMGAILLLAGVDARLGMPCLVQFHMMAIQQLLNVCRAKGIYLTDAIKRVIFWQDLNSSIMTGSSRVVDHTTFAELQWRRDPFSPSLFVLPPGFRKVSHLLTEELIELLKDIHAFQCIRDSDQFSIEDSVSMARIDNHQASIQSRLAGLRSVSLVLECCRLAAYLCSAMLRCKRWRTSVIPSHLSAHLIYNLQRAMDDPVWDKHPELLVWLVHMGGAFSPEESLRSDCTDLLRLNYSRRFRSLYESWPELLGIMKQYIWSDNAFRSQVQTYWDEVSTR